MNVDIREMAHIASHNGVGLPADRRSQDVLITGIGDPVERRR